MLVGLTLCAAGCDTGKTGPIVHLDVANYPEVVADNEVILIDFWAPWCGPCNRLSPTIEALAAEYEGKVTVCKVNVDEQPELANRFSVEGIPAVFVLKNGEPFREPMVGLQPLKNYQDRLDSALAD